MEAKGKILVKAGNGKGFKLSGVEKWFNANDESMLADVEKGEEVTVYYEKKGASQQVTKIVKAGAVEVAEAKCEVCGKVLKNPKFKKCYTCNMNKVEAKIEEDEPKAIAEKPKPYNDFNADRTAQIQRGNALNAASAVLAGRQEDPETLAEMVIVVADRLLEWLRAE